MRIGINTFVWVSPFSTESIGLVRKVKDFGFDVFEMACEEPARIDVGAVKAALDETGLGAIVCGVFGPDRDLSSDDAQTRPATKDYVRWMVDTAQALGAPVVCGPAYSSVGKARLLPPAERDAERRRAADGLRELGDYAGERGVRLALEPLNRFEVDMINTVEQGLALLDEIGSPAVGLHLDTFHMHIEEKDTEAAIRRAGDRLFHFHACENDRGIPGTGQVNWDGVARGLTAIEYDGVVAIEAFTPTLEAIARAVCLWRPLAPDQDTLARQGLAFLRDLLPLD
ncbi:MAG: sugar phosphate isomerase/epimerase family protein [Anaerolineae bacterium]